MKSKSEIRKESSLLLNIPDVTLIWEKLTANVKDKTILYEASGYCKPGQMLAIMGSSGAGKTTLLSLLAGKQAKQLQISGKVQVNKSIFSPQKFYNFGTYIFQNDILHEMLTVKQTLEFIARLRFKKDDEAIQRAKQMIQLFELQKCEDTYIGGQVKKGISGGEKKRVCIAVQMISKPSLLILDQPTSGLDSNKAKSIVNILKKLATIQNKTVIFTLHQPSYSIYQQLDRLILLDKGRTIYQGKSDKIYDYMTSLNISVPLNSTLSDFFMMEVSDYKMTKTGSPSQMSYEAYTKRIQPDVFKQIGQTRGQIQCEGFSQLKPVRSFFFAFRMLLYRQWIIFKRNPAKGIRTISGAILMLIIHGIIFLNGISDGRPVPFSQTQQNVYTNQRLLNYFMQAQGVMFISVTSNIMNGIFSVTLSFPNDRQIFYKETVSKKYTPLAYLFAKVIMEVSSVGVGIFLYGLGVFFMIGYAGNIWQFCFAMMCCALVGNSIGIMAGSLFKDAKRASALTPAFILPMMMFSGLYNKLGSIPEFIRWLQYLSPFRYGIHSILLEQFGNSLYMTPSGLFDYRADLLIEQTYWQNIGILLGLSGFYYFLTFIFMTRLSSSLAA